MSRNLRSFISALAIAFLDNFGYSLVFILFAPLILNPGYGFISAEVSEGAKNILLGVLTGIFPLFLFFSAPFWGDVGDRWGRKRAFIFTILGTILGHLLSAFAIFLQSYLFLLFARAISGLFSGNLSLCMATISDVSTDAKSKGRNFGIFAVSLGIGWISAMLIGGYLSDPHLASFFNPSVPFFLAAILTFVGYLIVQFLYEETHDRKGPMHFDAMKSIHEIKDALQHPEMRPFLYAVFFWSLGWYFTWQWFTPISLEHYHVTQQTVSFYLVILGICWVIGGVWFNSFLVKRFSSHLISLISSLIMVLFMTLSSITENYFLFSFFLWMATLAGPVSFSNLLNLVSISAPPSIQGKAMGFAQSFQALTGVLVPFAGGLVANLSILAIFPVGAAIVFIACLILARKSVGGIRS